MHKPKTLLASICVSLVTLFATPSLVAAAEKVTLLTAAPTILPAFAPWVLAQYKGYYAQEDIDVTFESAKGGVDAAKQIGVGNAQFAAAVGDTPIIVRANGITVKNVLLLGGGSLMQLVLRGDSAIKDVADLKGKTITVISYQDTTFYALMGVLAKVGLTLNDVSVQAVGAAGVWQLFVARQSDAMASVPDFSAEAIANGVSVRIIPANEHFQSMAQTMIASDKTIKERPELVRKMVRATLRAWLEIVKDPEAAASEYVKAVPQYLGQEKKIVTIFQLYNKYTYGGQESPGVLEEKRISELQDFYKKQGIIAKTSAVKDLYTNEFVQ